MANDKKFIVKNGLLTQETVVIGSNTDNGVNKLQVTGSSIFTQSSSATPTISITNTGGTSNSIIAQFVGDSDSLQVLNIGTGDYALVNSQQNNGIRFYDGTSGIEILYNGSVDLDFDSTGIDFKRNPTVNSNTIWHAGNDGTGSGLDADLLDGLNSLQFLRSDQDDTFDGNLIITGDLTVQGTTTTINTETILLADNIITLNSNYTGSTPSENAGIEVERGTLTNSSLVWDETSDWWKLISAGADLGRIITTADEGSGNGFDADSVDGLDSTQFLRSDVDDTAAGNIIIQGTLTVGNNTAAGATITMDGQAGNRYIYSNNGEIGFLNSAFAYAAYSDGSNNWRVLNDTYAKRFIDSDNNTYLLDPAGTSVLNTIDLEGQIRHNGDTDTYLNFNAADSFEVRTGGSQRLLVNNTAVTAINQMRSPIYYDNDDITYYGDFASTSRLNDISLVGQIIHDGDTNTYLDFNAADSFQVVTGGTARLTVTNTAVTGSVDFVAPRFVDSNNSSYYLDPANATLSLVANGELRTDYAVTVTAIDGAGNVAAAADEIRLSGYGLIGNRGTLYITNGGGEVQIGNGTTHNADPGLTISSTRTTSLNNVYAPLYYDSGNEAYYGDFASTSVMNTIDLEGSIRHNGDTNTFINFNAADSFQVVTGGTARLTVTNTAVTASVNMIAPQFVDSNNTAYYGDFASTSVMNTIDLEGQIRHNGDTDTYITFPAANQIGFYTGSVQRFLITDTYAESSNDLRAPRFIDLNSTSYYADFANTDISIEAAGTINAASANFYNGDTTNDLNIGRNVNERFNFNVTDGQGYIRYYQDETDSTDHSVNFEIISTSIGLNRFNFNKSIDVGSNTVSGAFGVFSSGVYAPIFYDNDNELFYADFNNTDVSIRVAGEIIAGNGSLATPTYSFNSDTNTGMYRYAADTIGFSAGGNDEFRILTTYALAVGQMRAPIYYDSASTGYYGDFASTSNMNRIDIDDYIRHRGDTDTYFGFSAADTIVAVTANTTRLTINTTGVTSTLDVTAPNFYGARFYDSGNVAYYADPASASVFNTLGIDSDLFHNGDTDNKISFGTDTQTFQTGGATRLTINNTAVTSAVNVFAPQYYTNDYLIHNGDTNTYIGFDANDQFGVWTAGSKRINVDTEVDLLVNTNVTGNLDVTGRATIGNSLTRPADLSVLTNSAARIGGSDVHLHIASLAAAANYAVAIQAGRQSDNASFPLAMQPNGGNVSIGTLTAGSILTINKKTAQGVNPFAAGASLLSLGDLDVVDFSIRTDSLRNIWNIVESTGQLVFSDSSASIFLAMDASTGDVIIGDQTAQFATSDGAPTFLAALSANKLHVNGGIQLNGSSDALSIYAADAGNTAINEATFLAVNELGFSAGGGWYMNETTTMYVRGNKGLYTTGNITGGNVYASRFYDADNNAYYVDPNGDSQMNTIDIDDYIRHRGDTNNYFGFEADDTFRVWTNAVRRLNIDNDSADFSVNVYAPRYYDSDNNAYYVDPASTSIMSRIDIDDYIRHRGDENNYFGFAANDTFRVFTSGAQRLNVDDNSADFGVDVYAPRYFDSNNTAFVGDFAGTSVMARITLPQNTVGVSHSANANVPTYYIGQQTGDNDGWKIFSESPAGTNTGALIIQSEDDYDANESIRLRFKRTASPYQTTDSLIAYYNYVQAADSFRAPIFYDSNNTAYYVDPNGDSQMNTIDIDDYIRHRGDLDNYFGFAANDTFRVFTGGTQRLNIDNDSADFAVNVYAPIFYDSNNNAYYGDFGGTSNMARIDIDDYIRHRGNTTSYFGFSANNIYKLFTNNVERLNIDTDSADFSVNVYAPRYYDSNDSTYYVDPASVSILNNVSFGVPGNGNTTKGRFLSIEGNTQSADGEASGRIFFAEHNATTASQDLFGMALAYQGGSTTINSVTGQPVTLTGLSNGTWGIIGYDNNVNGNWAMRGPRSSAYVEARGDFRAPLFYDSNNTAYYGDFASTSIMNVVRVNQLQIDGSTYIIDSPSGQYGSIRVDGALGGWAGYAIRDDWVFMADGATNSGIYNDTDNKWAIQFTRNAGTDLLFNGVKQAETENGYFLATNQMRAPIYYAPSSTSYWLDLDVGNTTDALRIPGRINRQGFAAGNGSTNLFLTAQDSNHFIWNTATNWGIFWATDTGAAYRYAPFGDNMITFVGAGNTRAAIDLDNGNAYFQGEVLASNFNINGGNENLGLLKTYGSGLGDTMLFDGTEYWEKRVIQNMQGVENSATTTTGEFVKNGNGPFASSYALRTAAYRDFYSDYIPVEPGEEIYGEIAVRYISGSGGLLYYGVEQYDKDKLPIAGNSGTTYFVVSAVNVTNTGWTTYRGHTTIPTSHTPFGGSDGGGCKYVRIRVLMNHSAGGALREFGPPILKRTNHLSNIVTQNIVAEGDVYANRYFDRNNPAFYVDPASISIMNDVRASIYYDQDNTGRFMNPATGGNVQGSWQWNNGSIVGLNDLQFADPGPNEGIHWAGGNNWRIYESPDNLTTNAAGNLQILYNNNQVGLRINTSGDGTFGRYAYAQRFYDSNNGAFYGDFASTSIMNLINMTGIKSTSSPSYGELYFADSGINYVASDPSPTGSRTLVVNRGIAVYSGYSTGTNRPHTYDITASFNLSNKAFEISADWVSGTGTPLKVRSLRDTAQGWSPWVDIATSTRSFTNTVDLRAPIFYDSNNTAFYTDPASTSVMNIVRANQLQIDGATYIIDSPSGQYGSIRVDGALGGYAGYAIRDDWVFMSNGATSAGIYNDTDNKWAILAAQNSDVQIYFNGTWEERSRSSFMEARGSYRAPIFYDSNNTAYRIDGNGTSRLLTLQVDNVIQGSVNGYAETLLRTDNRIISPNEDPAGRLRFGFTSWNNNNTAPYADYLHLRSYTDAGGGNDNLLMFRKDARGVRLWQQTWNSATAYATFNDFALYNSNPGGGNDLYASIYYDSNDTTYRVDPNGVSTVRQMRVAANTLSSVYNNAAIEVREYNYGGAQTDNYATAPRIGFHWSGRVASQIAMASSGEIRIINNPGTGYENFRARIVFADQDMRSPIFYDNNNTTYRGDFASTSRMNRLDVDSINIMTRGNFITFYNDTSDNHGIGSRRADGAATDDIRINTYNGLYINLDSNNNNTSGSDFRIGRHGAGTSAIQQLGLFDVYGDALYVYSAYSFRSPIFYDSNNTARYLDPASTSQLQSVTINGQSTMATQRAWVASNFGHGIYGVYSPSRYQHVWSMGTSYNLAADGTSTGLGGNLYGLAWAYNPDYSTPGTNAQAKAGLNHQLLLMMNGTTYFAAGNGMWTSGIATSTNSFRAPIFYDTNNTAYYYDGATLNGTRFEGVDFRTMAMISQPGTNINNSALYRARPRSTADSTYWTGSMGWGTVDMNAVATWGSGFIDSWGNPANQPAGTTHWTGTQAFHRNQSDTVNYGWQMVGGPIENLRFRSAWPSWRAWRTVPILGVNSNNDAAMYASIYYDANNTAYYCDPSSASNFNTSVRASEIYARNWFRNDESGEGLYNQQDGTHFYAQVAQEWRMAGNNNALAMNLRGLATYEGTSRFWLHGATDGYQGFLNSAGQWVLRISHNDALSPGIQWREEANENWIGNPGADVGQIVYHANRFYIASGSNSDRIVQFRRDGADVSWIGNDGVFNGTATSARYADLAERYEADAIYEAGTVLAIGGDKEVTLYQPGMPLAGAVSVKPGYRMNDKDYGNDNSIEAKMNPFVALKGRIPVKINGSAKKGQWIIADKDGKGRAVDYGSDVNKHEIIGVAISNGEGEVEVKI